MARLLGLWLWLWGVGGHFGWGVGLETDRVWIYFEIRCAWMRFGLDGWLVVYLDAVGIGGDFFARRLEVVPQAESSGCHVISICIEILARMVQKSK